MYWSEETVAFLRDAMAVNDYYGVIARRIAPHLARTDRVCDAGCGMGGLSLALRPYCAAVTAADRSALALSQLETRPHEGVTPLLCDASALRPGQPFDAMVFCLFGRTEDALTIAARCCSGRVFLVKRDYAYHRFSAGQVSLGEFTARCAEEMLLSRGIPYAAERFTAEFGQPFRTLEAAERFMAIYDRSGAPLSRAEIEKRLVPGPSAEFPYYLRHEKHLALFRFETKDIGGETHGEKTSADLR